MVFFSGAVAAATLLSVSPGLTGEIGVTLDAALVAVAAGVAHLLRRRVIVALELLLLFLAPPSRALNVLMKKTQVIVALRPSACLSPNCPATPKSFQSSLFRQVTAGTE